MRTHHKLGIALVAAGVTISTVVWAPAAVAARVPVSSKAAVSRVVVDVPGSIVSVRKATRDGLRAWAVTVKRTDGSVVVGYVHRVSGVVFDWTVQQAPDEPVLDLDGDDSSRGAAPVPPPVGAPLPDTATAQPRQVPTPAAPLAAATTATASTPSPESSDDVPGTHVDGTPDGTDHAHADGDTHDATPTPDSHHSSDDSQVGDTDHSGDDDSHDTGSDDDNHNDHDSSDADSQSDNSSEHH